MLMALLLLALFRVNMIQILLHPFLNKSSKKPLLPSLKEWTLLSWRSAELWRIRGVTEWVHNGPKCFILTYWQLFSWKASPRESDPTEKKLPCWRHLMGHCKWDLRERIETVAAWRHVNGISNMRYRQLWSIWDGSNHPVLCFRNWELTLIGSCFTVKVPHFSNIQYIDALPVCI